MKWFIGVATIVVLAVVWLWLERRRRLERVPESVVLLLQKPKLLNAQFLADLLGRESGRADQVRAIDSSDEGDEAEGKQPAGDMVMGQSPHFTAYVGGTAFLIHNVPAPYVNNAAEASESFPELRVRKAVRDHQAWLSMDILHAGAATPEAYRLVGRVLARLVDTNCLALYHPPLNRWVTCSIDETAERLRTDNPIQAVFGEMTEAPVIPFEDGDPRLETAKADAKRRFSEFETAFQNKDGTDFAIKAQISSDGNLEHIWVEVAQIAAGKIEGRLGNDPVDLGDLRLGSMVEVEVDQVEDWVFRRGDELVGFFSRSVFEASSGPTARP